MCSVIVPPLTVALMTGRFGSASGAVMSPGRPGAAGHLTRPAELRLSPYAYPGVQIVHPRLFDSAPSGTFSTNLVWDVAIAAKRLYGIRLDGVWIHVGTPGAVKEGEALLADLPAAR